MIRIHHMNLVTPPDRLDEERAFLVDVLELRPLAAPAAFASRAHWFEDEHGMQVHLTVIDDQPPLDPGHVAVVLGDGYEAMVSRVAKSGFPTKDLGPVTNCWDPAGNQWELRRE